MMGNIIFRLCFSPEIERDGAFFVWKSIFFLVGVIRRCTVGDSSGRVYSCNEGGRGLRPWGSERRSAIGAAADVVRVNRDSRERSVSLSLSASLSPTTHRRETRSWPGSLPPSANVARSVAVRPARRRHANNCFFFPFHSRLSSTSVLLFFLSALFLVSVHEEILSIFLILTPPPRRLGTGRDSRFSARSVKTNKQSIRQCEYCWVYSQTDISE